MIKIFKTIEGIQTIVDEMATGCWVNVIDPTPEDVQLLEQWGVEPELITYSLDMDEMARMERDEGYTLIMLRIPFYQGDSNDIPYATIPMGVILKNEFVVTVCKHENDIAKVLSNGKYRGLRTTKRYRVVLYALLETATRFLS
ncbi:MAG: magnesium transporter CorA family protein, partial [Chloroflexi bacterium]